MFDIPQLAKLPIMQTSTTNRQQQSQTIWSNHGQLTCKWLIRLTFFDSS
jgi:hypothetical protein